MIKTWFIIHNKRCYCKCAIISLWYTETFHAVTKGGIHASKKFYNVLLGNYKIVEEECKTEV
jgi:hypothetical protein